MYLAADLMLLLCLSGQGHKPQWQALLDYALSNKVDAVLDCGALLAGTTNRYTDVTTPRAYLLLVCTSVACTCQVHWMQQAACVVVLNQSHKVTTWLLHVTRCYKC